MAAQRPEVRSLCSRQQGADVVVNDPLQGGCANGDRLGFVATGRGRPYLALALIDHPTGGWVNRRGCSTTAWCWLFLLVSDGVLIEVKKGGPRTNKASRYRYTGRAHGTT